MSYLYKLLPNLFGHLKSNRKLKCNRCTKELQMYEIIISTVRRSNYHHKNANTI
jgi:hypothetical protein